MTGLKEESEKGPTEVVGASNLNASLGTGAPATSQLRGDQRADPEYAAEIIHSIRPGNVFGSLGQAGERGQGERHPDYFA